VLGLIFVAAEELDKEGGEFFSGAAQGFAGEERVEDGIAGAAGVEGFGETEAGGFATERFEE